MSVLDWYLLLVLVSVVVFNHCSFNNVSGFSNGGPLQCVSRPCGQCYPLNHSSHSGAVGGCITVSSCRRKNEYKYISCDISNDLQVTSHHEMQVLVTGCSLSLSLSPHNLLIIDFQLWASSLLSSLPSFLLYRTVLLSLWLLFSITKSSTTASRHVSPPYTSRIMQRQQEGPGMVIHTCPSPALPGGEWARLCPEETVRKEPRAAAQRHQLSNTSVGANGGLTQPH